MIVLHLAVPNTATIYWLQLSQSHWLNISRTERTTVDRACTLHDRGKQGIDQQCLIWKRLHVKLRILSLDPNTNIDYTSGVLDISGFNLAARPFFGAIDKSIIPISRGKFAKVATLATALVIPCYGSHNSRFTVLDCLCLIDRPQYFLYFSIAELTLQALTSQVRWMESPFFGSASVPTPK